MRNIVAPRNILIAAAVAGAVAVMSILAFKLTGGLYFLHVLKGQNTRKEKQILYELDHAVVAATLRRFAGEQNWPNSNGPPKYYTNTDPRVPIALRGLGFSIINIYDDRVDIDFGGPSLSFGLSVFPQGIEGQGTKKLGEGIWFYSEDGRVPPR
jgi:hypothetical protein